MKQRVKVIVYKDKKGEFRWRMKRSGRIVADSAEGYVKAAGARKAAASLAVAINRGLYDYEW